MAEFGCLETKTLKFCKDSEYWADISTIKTSKQKTEQESSKVLRYLQKHNFDYKRESMLCSFGNKKDTKQINIRLDSGSTTLFC